MEVTKVTKTSTVKDCGKRKRLQAIVLAASLAAGLAVGVGGGLLLAACSNVGTLYVADGNNGPFYTPCAGKPNGKCLISFETWTGHSVCNGIHNGDNCVASGTYSYEKMTSAGCYKNNLGQYECAPVYTVNSTPPNYADEPCPSSD